MAVFASLQLGSHDDVASFVEAFEEHFFFKEVELFFELYLLEEGDIVGQLLEDWFCEVITGCVIGLFCLLCLGDKLDGFSDFVVMIFVSVLYLIVFKEFFLDDLVERR